MGKRPGFPLLIVALWLGLPISASAQLQVEGKPQWGFDGLVRSEQFNLLTIDVANLSDRPWEGNFILEAGTGLSRSDIPILQPDQFIEAFGRRRLQFVVFVPRRNEYMLKWGRRPDQSYQIDEPDEAREPAIVQFVRPEAVRAGVDGVPTFDESEFPTSAAGLTGLGTVILDHVPRWSEAQTQAFSDWILAGGTVHLFQETAGITPEFSGRLQSLNEPSDVFPLGGGIVYRHKSTAQQSETSFSKIRKAGQYYRQWNVSDSLFTILKEITRPQHNWIVIYLLAVAYLLLLFPGCWLLGRKRGDYRITYGAVLGIIALFSFGFRTVGARGYGESTSINAVAVVRPTSGGRAVVTMWSNLFVTSGSNYDIRHPFEGNVYSTGQMIEAVPGFALNRPIGRVQTEIPSFSSRTLVNTGVVNDFRLTPDREPFQIDLVDAKLTGGGLTELSVRVQGLSSDASLFVVSGDRLAALRDIGDGTHRLQSPAQMLGQAINQDFWRVNRNYSGVNEATTDQLLQKTRTLLLSWDLGLSSDEERNTFKLPEGEIRVYAEVDLPPALHTPSISEQQRGRALIVVPFHIDENSGESTPVESADASESEKE
ncbi:MAG: hypothetical protein KDA80_12810 [Planctomycetaceae bacterium]|nr:hypothetical protein [Planctomycetaceae bacterium]